MLWGLVATGPAAACTRASGCIGQAVHRTTAIASVALPAAARHGRSWRSTTSPLIGALIPFALGVTGTRRLIGFGSLAGLPHDLRRPSPARCAAPSRPRPRSRPAGARMHMLAYPAWCFALVHGLYAGRAAKPIFVILYWPVPARASPRALALRAAPRPVKRKVADRIIADPGLRRQRPRPRPTDREARPALPGHDRPAELRRQASARGPRATVRDAGQCPLAASAAATADAPLDDAPCPAARRGASSRATDGFAAAYRAVSTTPRGAGRLHGPDPTPHASCRWTCSPHEAIPRMDDGSHLGAPAGRPRPRRRSARRPRRRTTRCRTPSPVQTSRHYGQTFRAPSRAGVPGPASSDVVQHRASETSYGTAETNAPYGTYNPNDTYNSGPATETTPGASYDFDAPSSGEPWNAPSGGYK